MLGIIIGLVVALIIVVVVVNGIQQHKEKLEQEKKQKAAKFKAIIDESEELIMNLAHLPANPNLASILNRRSLNAAKAMVQTIPESKQFRAKVQDLESRLAAAEDMGAQAGGEDKFVLPDNEQQLVVILQTIKKLRTTLKAEQNKGALDAQMFMAEDQKLEGMQLKINVETLYKRGNQAYQKEMLGSARQYFEKALQTLASSSHNSDYARSKKAEIEEQLSDITNQLKNANAADAAKKAKEEKDDLDMLFQPKKKW